MTAALRSLIADDKHITSIRISRREDTRPEVIVKEAGG